MENHGQQKVINASNIFDQRFLDTKTLYLYYFNAVPSIHFIGSLNGEKAFMAFKESFHDIIIHEHLYRWYEKKKKKYQFDRTILKLKNNCLIEFGISFCQLFHDGSQSEFIDDLTVFVNKFKERQRRKPLEINLIVNTAGVMDLKGMEIKRANLDLGLFYEDDFKDVSELIIKRLNKEKDKGIVLLHGLPGTGKTSYLRHLIGRIKKKVLFLSPNVAGDLMNPDLIELLIDNPNSVLIIEDAENIIMDRKSNSGSSVSNLLNISDGLLADFLNLQVICTFNSALTLVDSALLRKGRMIAKYEFGKLSVTKSQRLSDHLGFKTRIPRPMTIAEIANQNEKTHTSNRIEIIGFKREMLEY